ncbi:MAG: RluA family pseudouridine synthase [Verrucomicrobiota bacterium]
MVITIEPEEAVERLDRILAARMTESRSQIQRWIHAGRVNIDGEPVLSRGRYPEGTQVVIDRPKPEAYAVVPEQMELDVLFEDEDLIVLNKAAGLVVHPGAGCRTGTLVSGLLEHCQGQLSGIGGVERPGIVHRLDKETSGVIAVAKNDFTHQKLSNAFQQRQVIKIYQAFSHRAPRADAGSWEFALGRHPVHRKKQAVVHTGGRSARTDFQVLQRWDKFCKLELELFTGRTHQIRVHAAHAGTPLAGDTLYGGKLIEAAAVHRQMLHAMKLVIHHPRSGDRLAITAPVPEDFIRFESWLNQRHPLT